MQTDNHHNEWKVDAEKNGSEVSQNNILFGSCYKLCTLLELRDHEESQGAL